MLLVFQAYGKKDIINQNIFSIFSLLNSTNYNLEKIKILIYTDQVLDFKKYFDGISNIEYREIQMEQIKKWRGAIDFVHRVKVEILKEAYENHQTDIFYVDGDTVFLNNPNELFLKVNNQNSLMHIFENIINQGKDPLSKKIKKFLKKNHPEIPTTTSMWNAGALGISKTIALDVFEHVLKMTDQLYSEYPKHTMEQLAFSFVLQTKTKINPAEKEILHYWNQKDEYQNLINQFLSENSDLNSVKNSYKLINWPKAPKPKLKFWEKAFNLINGRN